MLHKTRKRLIRWIFLPIAGLVILILIAVGILYAQRQRLVELAVKELNGQIPGELIVGPSDIAIFQNFPYISIGLNNVQLYPDKSRGAEPIYEAGRIFVGFSLSDILRQEYHAKVIACKNGRLDLVQDKDGKLNITEALRMAPDTTTSKKPVTALDLDIKKFVLKEMEVSFVDKASGQKIASRITRIQTSFRADNRRINADLHGDMIVDYSHPGSGIQIANKHLLTDIKLGYDRNSQLLTLPEARIQLGNAVFNITGTADLLHDNLVDLHIAGDKPDFKQLFAFAPEKLAKELKHFHYDGELSFDGKIKGDLKTGKMPLIEVSFSCSKAWLDNMETHKKVDSLAFSGFFSNGAEHSLRTSELRLLDIRARPGEGVFSGNFVMRDFTDPKILMQVNSELELGFVAAFLGIKDLQRITGHISLKMDFKDLVDLSLPRQSISKLTQGIQSELTVRNLTFRIPSYPFMIEHLDLHAKMKDGVVILDSLYFNLGNSDFHLDGSISDLPAIFHHRQQPLIITLNAHSNKIIPKELLAFDSARAGRANEEVYGFNLGLSLETSVDELLHPKPLPRGKLKLAHLSAAFKRYPHAFHDFGADLTINDTSLLLKNFAGSIDSSDIRFSGRVNNYALWFDKVKKGRTQLAFDFKSQHLAMHDLLGKHSRQYLPPGYYQETGSNIWLRSKIELRYDSVCQFANIRIANISGALLQHGFQLDSISGNVKIGADNFLKIDTLKGKVGQSDFNLSMRLYTGKDTNRRKKENFLQFSSRFLNLDELTNYALTVENEEKDSGNSTLYDSALAAPAIIKTSGHSDGFNIFQIPFIDFSAKVNIGRIRYHHLGLKNLTTDMRMQANQQLFLDTLGLEIAGGRISANAHFDGADPNKIYLKSRICAEDVNIEKLMLKMDYLGQDYVINKNIKGSLSGQIESYVQVHPDLTPLIKNSAATLDMEIINGSLVNFSPMQAMASYFKDKNLNQVRFDTLRNTLTFKDGTLSIPDMNINSSLGYMEISGSQSMDMHMEYYLRIPLKMVTEAGFHLLFGKKKEEVDPDQVDAIEYRDKEKKVRFMNLRITGTPDNYKVHLGKAKKTS
jgi:uncharacterized protein involved in outer membrane biogenesis